MKGIALTSAAIAAHCAALGVDIAQEHDRQMAEAVFPPPDRLSVDRDSPHFDVCYKRMGVRFNGEERQGDVQEYCVSEGWIVVRKKTALGKFLIDHSTGSFVFETLHGKVEPYWRQDPPRPTGPTFQQSEDQKQAALDRAAEKRARKAAKLAGRA